MVRKMVDYASLAHMKVHLLVYELDLLLVHKLVLMLVIKLVMVLVDF